MCDWPLRELTVISIYGIKGCLMAISFMVMSQVSRRINARMARCPEVRRTDCFTVPKSDRRVAVVSMGIVLSRVCRRQLPVVAMSSAMRDKAVKASSPMVVIVESFG